MQNLFNDLKKLLEKDGRLSADGQLLKNKIVELAHKLDEKLVKLLLSNKKIKERFFRAIDGAQFFDKDLFVQFINNKEFLPDSYTRFSQNIGLLHEDGRMFKEINAEKEVVLVWPYKDCVLEGGQTKEDAKRNEIFWNEILAPDEIDRLLDPKVFTNFKRVSKRGEHKAKEIKDKDNLIIKGNNLLALHSLKKKFSGKIKLIYIDPPYNPDSKSNTFCYNNTFNRSTWLTFMKNRLEAAKDLLSKDGVFIIAIDDNEHDHLGVLLREIFNEHETHCITIVHNPRGIQGENFSYTHEYAFFVIPRGIKSIGNRKIKEGDIEFSSFRNWGGESLRTDARNCFYPVIIEGGKIVGFGNVMGLKKHPKGQTVKTGNKFYVYPIDKEGVERKWRYARQSVEEIKHLLRAKKTDTGYEIEIGKDFGAYRTVWIDKRYDANEYGTKLVKSLVPGCKFDFPKSLYNVYDCLYAVVANDKDAIILDFFGGSGTTAHAVLELNKKDKGNRQFILVEQMYYVKDITVPRVKKVIEKDNLDEDFVYCELMKWNEVYVEKIKNAKTKKDLEKIWKEMQEKAFLSYRFDSKKFNAKEFAKLSVPDQKKFLLEVLDKNQLYVNLSEINDKQYKVGKEDKRLNKEFYG